MLKTEPLIRKALEDDALQLAELNAEFNGPGGPEEPSIRKSLRENRQEEVFVAEESGTLTGFLCVQLKRSFCYTDISPEVTELYVRPEYRKKGTASALLSYAEQYCISCYPVHKFDLLTGDDNQQAISLYGRSGYRRDGEIHMSKRVEA